jgi:membrane protease YdiL (CAAX protease family)
MSYPNPSPAVGSVGEPAVRAPGGTSTYDHALHGNGGWWRGAVAIVGLVAAYLFISFVLGALAIGIDVATGITALDDLAEGLVTITPLVMLANNLSLAALIPLSLLLQRLLFGVPARSLFSVTSRFRWSWLWRLALIIVPVWVVYVAASFLLSPAGEVRIDGTVLAMLAVIVLTTPLQSAGEEFGFRGLVQRSAGSWLRSPIAAFIVSTVISASLFCVAHFAADPWLIAYYFVFGVSASITARLTGGLEAPVLIHVANNVLLLVPAVLLGQLDEGFDRSVGTGGPFMIAPMLVVLGAALLSGWWARRNRVATMAPRPAKVPRFQESAQPGG